MVTKKKTLCVYIGRFQPFHNGHEYVLTRAAKKYDEVLVLIGSTFRAPDPKNPWSFEEREEMIRCAMQGVASNISFDWIRDFPHNDPLWIAEVRSRVSEVNFSGEYEIYLTGADRDDSTFYLKYFPDYKLDLVDGSQDFLKGLNATDIRKSYFETGEVLNVSPRVRDWLTGWSLTARFKQLQDEHKFNVSYQEDAKKYETIFQTVDSVVIQTGHVLLIERKNVPGKGLWALPGGYLNPRERQFDAAIRELREETRIKVPEPVLRGCVKADRTFDDPGRSLRGRVITRCFGFRLPDHVVDGKIDLPKVKGSDDAKTAFWVPLDEVHSEMDRFFEDHYFIIETMLGVM